MKKFLTVTSLFLVAMMLFSVVPASAATVNAWEAPESIQKWYANDISANAAAPVIDGVIADGEYGDLTARMTPDDRLTMSGESTGSQDSVIDDTRTAQPASDYIDFYFAYDANFIYIAIEDMGGTWEEGSETYEFIQNLVGDGVNVGNFATRNNYHFNTGFLLDDCTSYISMQASSRGFDENKWFDQGSAQNSNADPVYGVPTAFVNEAYIKKSYVESGEVFGDAPGGYKNENGGADRGNNNQFVGQYKAVIELKYSKAQLIGLLNNLYGYDFVELPNAMWFWFVGRTYAVKDVEGDGVTGSAHGGDVTGYNRYFATDIRESDVDYFDIGIPEGSSWQTVPNLIVFGDENTELSWGREEGDPEYGAEGGDEGDETTEEVVDNTTEEVEDVTTTKVNDADDDDEETTKKAETKAPETTAAVEEKGGCANSVSVAGLALVAALGTCTVFVAKKKED